jgi:hypothetical protein
MIAPKDTVGNVTKKARFLQSLAALVKDAAEHDRLQQEARILLTRAAMLAEGSTARRPARANRHTAVSPPRPGPIP